jgi:hypothetical protein
MVPQAYILHKGSPSFLSPDPTAHEKEAFSHTDNVLRMKTCLDLNGTSLALAKQMSKASALNLITI